MSVNGVLQITALDGGTFDKSVEVKSVPALAHEAESVARVKGAHHQHIYYPPSAIASVGYYEIKKKAGK